MYAAVPRITPAQVAGGAVSVGSPCPIGAGSASFANPKSSTFTTPSRVIFTLAGFRSRWMIPFSCAASSASAMDFALSFTPEQRATKWKETVAERMPR